MKSPRQVINGAEQEVAPIVDLVHGPKEVTRGCFILRLFKRSDPDSELFWPATKVEQDLLGSAAAQTHG